jgi:hypothetical protein
LALAPLLGRAPRELLAPALPYSVIVANDGGRSIALLGVRFNMTGPYAKQYSVIHYADSLRNPDKADFLAGTKRFVCAEPSFTALLLRRDGDLSSRGRSNLDNLRRMLDIQASLDCIAWDDGRFEGPDTQGAFERLERQREMERMFVDQTPGMSLAEAEKLLLEAAEDPKDRARRAIARKLLEGLQSGGRDGMLEVARNHRLKIGVWREGRGTGIYCNPHVEDHPRFDYSQRYSSVCSATRGRFWWPWTRGTARYVAGGFGGPPGYFPYQRAAGTERPYRRRGYPEQQYSRHDDQRRERRLGSNDWSPGAGRVSLQLQCGWLDRGGSAQRGGQRISFECLESGGGARVGLLRYEGGAAWRGGLDHILFDGAEEIPPHACLHAAGV